MKNTIYKKSLGILNGYFLLTPPGEKSSNGTKFK